MKCLKRNMLVVGLVVYSSAMVLNESVTLRKYCMRTGIPIFRTIPREVLQLMILGVTHLHMACSEGAEEEWRVI